MMRARDGSDGGWGRAGEAGLDTTDQDPQDDDNGPDADTPEHWASGGGSRGSGGLLPPGDNGGGRGGWREGGGYGNPVESGDDGGASMSDGVAERRAGGGRHGSSGGRAWGNRGGARDDGQDGEENVIGEYHSVRSAFTQDQRSGASGNGSSAGLVDRSVDHSTGSPWLPGHSGASESFLSNAPGGGRSGGSNSRRTGASSGGNGGMMSVDAGRGLASLPAADETFNSLGRAHHSGSVNPANTSPALYGDGGGGGGSVRDRNNGWDPRDWSELGTTAAAAAVVARGEVGAKSVGIEDRFSSSPPYDQYYGGVGSMGSGTGAGGGSAKGGYPSALPLSSGGDVVREHGSGGGLELGPHGLGGGGSGTRGEDGASTGRRSPGGFDPNAPPSRYFNPGVDSPFEGADDDDGERVGRWAGGTARGLGLVRTPSDEAASRVGAARALVEGLAKSANCTLSDATGGGGRSSDLPRRGQGQHDQRHRPGVYDGSYKSTAARGTAGSAAYHRSTDDGETGTGTTKSSPSAPTWPNGEGRAVDGNGRFSTIASVSSDGESPRSVMQPTGYGTRPPASSSPWSGGGSGAGGGGGSQSPRTASSAASALSAHANSVEVNRRVPVPVGHGMGTAVANTTTNSNDIGGKQERAGDRSGAFPAAKMMGGEHAPRSSPATSCPLGTRASGGGEDSSNNVDLSSKTGNGGEGGRESVGGGDRSGDPPNRSGEPEHRSGDGATSTSASASTGGGGSSSSSSSGSGAAQQAATGATGGGHVVKRYDTMDGISMDRKSAEEPARNVFAATTSTLQ